MAGFSKAIADRIRRVTKPRVAPWWEGGTKFRFRNHKYELFVSNHNCGWPPGRMTERGAELALADKWMRSQPDAEFVEVGAVTPYYWPGRVATVIDPTDKHFAVTHRIPVADYDLTNKHVVSISTVEHIGRGDYKLDRSVREACVTFDRMLSEPATAFVTFPIGFNATLDQYVIASVKTSKVAEIAFLARGTGDNAWRQVFDGILEQYPYGHASMESGRRWANCICIAWKGGVL